MKKINPKVTKVVLALLSILLVGGLAAREAIGGSSSEFSGADTDNDGFS